MQPQGHHPPPPPLAPLPRVARKPGAVREGFKVEEMEELEGIWLEVALEENGVRLSPEELVSLAPVESHLR